MEPSWMFGFFLNEKSIRVFTFCSRGYQNLCYHILAQVYLKRFYRRWSRVLKYFGTEQRTADHVNMEGYLARPLSTTNKMADKGDILAASLIFFSLVPLAAAFQCLGLLFCALLIEKFARKVIPSRHIFAVFSPRLARLSRYEPYTWQKDSPPRRVPRASRQGAPGRRVALSNM